AAWQWLPASTCCASPARRPAATSPTDARCRTRRNAFRRELLGGHARHVRVVTPQQPRRKRLDEIARSRDSDGAVAQRRTPRDIAEPDVNHRVDSRIDIYVHLETRVRHAEIHFGGRQYEPKLAIAAAFRGHAAEVELDDGTPRR